MNKLKRLRLAAGLLSVDVARELNTTPCQLTRWESGKNIPRANYLAGLAKLYNVSIDEVIESVKRDD